MATETLLCLGPPEHVWERERARGRKPVYCPDHKPDPGETLGEATVKRSIERTMEAVESDERVTGVTDATADPKENPFITKAKNREKMQKAREAKSEKAREDEERSRQRLREEHESMPERVAQHELRYTEAFHKACAETASDKIDKAWDQADREMDKLIRVLDRERELKAIFENDDDDAVIESTTAEMEQFAAEDDFEIQAALD